MARTPRTNRMIAIRETPRKQARAATLARKYARAVKHGAQGRPSAGSAR